MPDSITALKYSSFSYCTSLTSINLPGGLKELGYESFRNCTSLTSIKLPESLETISSYVFSGCFGLKKVVFNEKDFNSAYIFSSNAFDVVEDFAIYGHLNSSAHDYATKNNIKFVSLDPLKGDMSGDGVVNINDVTDIQTLLASNNTLTDEQLAVADVDDDGIVCVRDATHVQKYFAGIVDTL